MQSKLIQWFPGHMAKTKRLIKESISLVDLVIEILDARIPYSSHNPDIEALAGSKPRLILATVNAGFYVHGATEGSYMYDINGTNINIINEAVYELAEEYNLELVDTYALTKDHPEYYKIDGIHPDKNGQKAMAEAFYQEIID